MLCPFVWALARNLWQKQVSKLLEDDIAGLWPTDRAKVKAEIRGWLDDSPEEQQHAPTEKDLTVREKTGSSTFEIVSGWFQTSNVFVSF